MLRVINESWDKWLDEVFDRHLIQILVGCLLAGALVIGTLFVFGVRFLVVSSLQTQMGIYELEVRTLRQQQEANQRDTNRLIDEQYYIKEEMRRMRR